MAAPGLPRLRRHAAAAAESETAASLRGAPRRFSRRADGHTNAGLTARAPQGPPAAFLGVRAPYCSRTVRLERATLGGDRPSRAPVGRTRRRVVQPGERDRAPVPRRAAAVNAPPGGRGPAPPHGPASLPRNRKPEITHCVEP